MGSQGVVDCSVCGKPLKPIGNYLDGFKAAGWLIVDAPTAGWSQWLGTVCGSCRKVYCPDCCNAGGGPCPDCGQDVMPAAASFLPVAPTVSGGAASTAPRGLAVRVLIAHTGDTFASQDANEILRYGWDGEVSPDVRITSNPLGPTAWATDEGLAISWSLWQSMLQHRYGEPPYWDTHEKHAFSGTVVRTGQRFYAEIYYKAECDRPAGRRPPRTR
jgi:hypothetical protein